MNASAFLRNNGARALTALVAGIGLWLAAATAQAIVDMARGLIARRLFEAPRADVDHETDVCTDLIWNGIAVRRGQKS